MDIATTQALQTEKESGFSRVRKPTAVSQVLRILQSDAGKVTLTPVPPQPREPGFTIEVANTCPKRERAYWLAQQVYKGCGYTPEDSRLMVTKFDACPETLTLLAVDEQGTDVATITLLVDSPMGLPCDEIYGPELNEMRARNCKLVEVTRLAIAEEYRHSKKLLVQLFNHISVWGRRILGATDVIVEVNPRHVTFYQRLMRFHVAGPERACPRVENAPAVLLGMNLAYQEEVLRQLEARSTHEFARTIYAWFMPLSQERALARRIAFEQRPMTEQELEYFGLEVNAALSVGMYD